MKRLSVVIANYNYERFIGTAIESALALRWDDVEVIVVDDGSTDNSPAIIAGYAERVRILMSDNVTQRVAANRGYAMTTGDVVIFLDSDDVLPPELPGRLDAVMTSSVSKTQFRMQRIDAGGRAIGTPFPEYRPVPTPADIRLWASKTTAYPTPPGSGNAYASWYLEKIFPLEPSIGDFADSGCLAAAPFFGDVVSLPEVVIGYRQHGGNDSNLLLDSHRFPREVERARARWNFAQRAMGVTPADVDDRPLFRSRELLQLRVAARRMASDEQQLKGDNVARMLMDSLRSPLQVGPESVRHRALVAGWCLAVLLGPIPLARRLIAVRYGRHTSANPRPLGGEAM